MEKLIKNKEIRKLAFGVTVITTTIFLVFFSIFAVIGNFSNNKKEQKLNKKIIEIYELNFQMNELNDEIAVYEAELEKIEFIAHLKKELRLILMDRERFNVEVIDEDHLYFMESQRAQYNIPKHIYYRLIFAESGFRMFDGDGNVLRSSGGAMGYMQMLTSTFNWINSRYDLNLDDVGNPYDNIAAGAFYLNKRKENIKAMFPNASETYMWKLTIASYNAGLEDVRKARGIPTIRYHNSRRFKFGDPNTETMAYVNFITRNFMSDEQLLAML